MIKVFKLPNGQRFSFFSLVFLIALIQGVWTINLHAVGALETNSGSLTHDATARSTPSPTKNVKTTTTPPISNRCPLPERIYPCTCDSSGIHCTGAIVAQETIQKVMNEVREVNGVTTNDLLYTGWWTFNIWSTSLTSFDLSPLLNSQFNSISIYLNDNLSRIHGPLSSLNSSTSSTSNFSSAASLSHSNSIDVRGLYLHSNNLTDDGLADCFHYFTLSILVLNLEGNSLQGPSSMESKKPGLNEPREFLPGLWKFVTLTSLYLGTNKITLLKDAPFNDLGQLQLLTLGCVEEVGKNGLLMDDTRAPLERTIVFYYDECSLSDEKIQINHGLDVFTGQTALDFTLNSFEFFSREKFEPFLQVDQNNTIEGLGNRFVCDERMKWLKDGRELYENRVFNVDCINDPGHTIFTTDLV